MEAFVEDGAASTAESELPDHKTQMESMAELVRLLNKEKELVNRLPLNSGPDIKIFSSIQVTFSPPFLQLLQFDQNAVRLLEDRYHALFMQDSATDDTAVVMPTGSVKDFLAFYKDVLCCSCDQLMTSACSQTVYKDVCSNSVNDSGTFGTFEEKVSPLVLRKNQRKFTIKSPVSNWRAAANDVPTTESVPEIVIWDEPLLPQAHVPGGMLNSAESTKTVDIVLEIASADATPTGKLKPTKNIENDDPDEPIGSIDDDDDFSAPAARTTGQRKIRFHKKNCAAVKSGAAPPRKDYESMMPYRFFCDVCSFKSKRRNHLNKHMDMHRSNPELDIFTCDLCDYKTIRLSCLQRHKLSHSVTNEIERCDMCNYKTTSFKLLQKHRKLKHDKMSPMPKTHEFACKACDYRTHMFARFERHLQSHSTLADVGAPDEADGKYSCPLCIYHTRIKEHIIRHVKNVHSDTRPYLCDVCGKSFKRPDGLKVHKEVHQNNRLKAFECWHCQKRFRSKAHLSEHLSTHSDIRAYLCEICGAPFKTRSVQRKHEISIHKQPRSFHCQHCTKCFNTKFALKRHLSVHLQTDLPDAISDSIQMGSLQLNLQRLGDVSIDPVIHENDDGGADHGQSAVFIPFVANDQAANDSSNYVQSLTFGQTTTSVASLLLATSSLQSLSSRVQIS